MGIKIFNKDPKLLQTERYRTNERILDLVEQKGGSIDVNPVTLDITHEEYNPPQIKGPDKGKEGGKNDV